MARATLSLVVATVGMPRLASAQTSPLPAEAQARLAQAEQAMSARNLKVAREIAGPLFEAYPSVFVVQDFRCQLALVELLPREQQETECAALKRLSGSPDAGPAAHDVSQPPSNPPPGLSRPQNDLAGAQVTPASESPSVPGPPEGDENQARSEPSQPSQPAHTGRELVAPYYTGVRWSIGPGAVFGNGKVGFSLAGRIGYGVDTGSVIVMPGVSLAGYFLNPNVYVGMPTVELFLPIGPFVPFVEGGAGIGVVTQPSQTSLAVLGGGGFVLHPTREFLLGLELGYETIVATDFREIIFGPIFAFAF
jgi:hypothetical protein